MALKSPRQQSVTITTIADGSATDYIAATSGLIEAIIYTKVDYADGVDFTITTEDTGQNVWVDTNINAAETVYPVAAENLNSDGSALSFYRKIPLCGERIKIVIAAGGDTKSGTFTAIVSNG